MQLPMRVRRLLDRAERLFPEAVGVVCGPVRLTYAAYAQRVNRLSHALAALGTEPGDRVAYLGPNCHRLLEAYYGVVQTGRVLLPLNVRLSAAELGFILDDAAVRLMLVGSGYGELARQALAAMTGPPPRCVWAGDGPPPPELPHAVDYEDALAAAPADRPRAEPEESDLAELFYTSGTTGRPKGVMLTQRNLYAHAFSVLAALPLDDTAVQIHTLPLFHVNGWGTPHTVTAMGGRHVVLPRFEAGAVLQAIAREGVTHMFLVPTMALALLDHPSLPEHDLSSLRRVVVGGAAASPTLIGRLERALGCTVTAAYGLSETTPFLTVSGLKATLRGRVSEEERLRRLAMAGLPVPGAEIELVDEALQPVPHDGVSVGELVVRGDMVMAGYWNRPEETAAAFRGGVLHTGDLAVWDAEGYLQLVDRQKDIVISGGENISSIEVENALYTHPGVAECAVIARPDPVWGEVPVAYVVLRDPAPAPEALIAHVRARLAHFKAPREVVAVATLPKTGTGKIQKHVLRDWDRQRQAERPGA